MLLYLNPCSSTNGVPGPSSVPAPATEFYCDFTIIWQNIQTTFTTTFRQSHGLLCRVRSGLGLDQKYQLRYCVLLFYGTSLRFPWNFQAANNKWFLVKQWNVSNYVYCSHKKIQPTLASHNVQGKRGGGCKCLAGVRCLQSCPGPLLKAKHEESWFCNS